MIVIILVINVALVAAFAIFYRQKRKYWSKRVDPGSSHQMSSSAPPPPLPSRPSSGASYNSAGVMLKSQSPYSQPQGVARQRIAGLHSSLASLPRNEEVEA